MTASTHFGRKYNQGRRKNVASKTSPLQTKDAIWVRPPTSPLIRDLFDTCYKMEEVQIDDWYLVIDPKAGRVPGTKEATRLAAPRATSSRLGLIEYPNRAAFCFAATMLSRKPTTAIILK